jgi:hypothetical protein
VRDLFYKWPVRKKILLASNELEDIKQRMEAIALAHPDLSFSLYDKTRGTKLMQSKKVCPLFFLLVLLFLLLFLIGLVASNKISKKVLCIFFLFLLFFCAELIPFPSPMLLSSPSLLCAFSLFIYFHIQGQSLLACFAHLFGVTRVEGLCEIRGNTTSPLKLKLNGFASSPYSGGHHSKALQFLCILGGRGKEKEQEQVREWKRRDKVIC